MPDPTTEDLGAISQEASDYFDARAFWATDILEQDVLDEAKAVLADGIRRGLTYPELSAALDEVLAPYLPERNAAGDLINVPARLETIARTNVADAMGQGRLEAFTDPDVEGFVTGLQYTAILDSRVRENHAAWDQVTKPMEFWEATDRVPPCGFNCRCLLLPVTAADDMSETPDDALPNVADPSMDIPDPGFRDDVPAGARGLRR